MYLRSRGCGQLAWRKRENDPEASVGSVGAAVRACDGPPRLANWRWEAEGFGRFLRQKSLGLARGGESGSSKARVVRLGSLPKGQRTGG